MRSPWLLGARALAALILFVVVAVVAGVMAVGLTIPALSATDKVTSASADFLDSLPTRVDELPLPQKSIMYAADGSVIAQFYAENRVPVGLNQISPVMRQAIVAIEDSRFYEHHGVDSRGVLRALVHNAAKDNGNPQGASTLTMQYVRNLLIEQAVARGDKVAVAAARKVESSRKIREMRLAVELEKRLSKDAILEGYLNIADFGDRVYGVEAAARYYFGLRSAAQLSLSQAATLAGMVQSPARLNPRADAAESQARRNVVLKRMASLKLITTARYRQAATRPLAKDVRITAALSGCANAGLMAYYCDYVLAQLEKDPGFAALGKTQDDRDRAIEQGGLTIRTTIQPALQKAAWRAVEGHLPHNDPSRIATSAVTVQPGTGRVLAMTQNRIYRIKSTSRGATSINYGVDRRYGGSNGFQTGSTFKPFTLATWLSKGKHANDQVSADKKDWVRGNFLSCGRKLRGTKPFHVDNSEGDEGGMMTVTDATAKSVNAAYMSMESQLDLCDVARTAGALGVHTAVPTDDCGTGTESAALPACIPTLTLGVKEIAPVTMAAAYAAFADYGVYCQPRSVTAVLGRGRNGRLGKPLPIPGTDCRQAIPSAVAAGVAYVMQRTLMPGGTAQASNLANRPAAGKTGTTNNDLDTWFVGYTRQLSTAIWVGDPTIYPGGHRRNLKNRRVNGRFYPNIYGFKMAAPIWKEIMVSGGRGMPVKQFPGAPGWMIGKPPPPAAGQPGKPAQPAQPPGQPGRH